MNYTEDELNALPKKDGFRLRGIETTRLETFMDAAFAFAITMMVISVGEVPKDFSDLLISLKEIPAFLLSFFVIMLFWLSHRSFSRRYGLEDRVTIALSIGLIFILLVYIYPLRIMFSSLFTWLSKEWFPVRFSIQGFGDMIGLFSIYGFGLFAIAGIISLLYLRALRKKTELQLNDLEVHKTKMEIASLTVVSITGLVSAVLALILPGNLGAFSVTLYITIPITMILVGRYYNSREKRISKP
jgi:uncharacterized membrane protein